MSDTQQPVNPLLPSPPTESKVSLDFLIQEYNALRAEILKRTEMQHQLLSLALIASGTFLTIGFEGGGSPTVVLAYPILAMFLSLAWCQSDILIRQIGNYIRIRIEGRLLGNEGGWEAYLHELRSTGRSGGPVSGEHRRAKRGIEHLAALVHRATSLLVAGGIFVGTQILAVFLSLFQTRYLKFSENTVLLLIDVVVIVCTVLLLKYRLKYRSHLSSQ